MLAKQLKSVNMFEETQSAVQFEMTIHEPYKINKTSSETEDTRNITLKINQVLEKMVVKNPTQWIWSHNRWK